LLVTCRTPLVSIKRSKSAGNLQVHLAGYAAIKLI